MEIEKKVSEFKSLSKVVARVDLENIFLLSSNVWRSLDALEFDDIDAEIGFSGILLEDRKDHFIAKVQCFAKGRAKDRTEEEKEIISISSEYILTYSLKDRKVLAKKDLEIFCSMNSIYNAWPYWREFIQSISNRMEIPTLTLPLLKFRPPKKQREGDGKKEKK
jgi:hypothetical protein